MFGGGAAPDCDGGGGDRLYHGCVELHHQFLRQVELQEVHPLLGSLNDGADVTVPLEVIVVPRNLKNPSAITVLPRIVMLYSCLFKDKVQQEQFSLKQIK